MTVGFFTVFRKDPQHYVLAEVLIRSVRAALPGVEIVQFTDETSPQIHGVDAVRRKPHGRMLERRLEHYAEADGEWLLIDTDVVVQQDVRGVFGSTFDVAMADRNWSHLPKTPDLTALMPFNTGVVFSRSTAFWRAVLATWRGFTPEQQADWYSEQLAVAAVVRAGAYSVLTLPGMVYNYPPATAADAKLAAARIVHYKGNRKPWMAALQIHVPAVAEVRQSPAILHIQTPAPSPTRASIGPVSPLRVFIGYDPRQPVAFHVAAHSVQSRATVPVSVTRLQLNQLPITRRGLTEFTYSRFLVPYLSGFDGWSVFLDADMLCLGDVAELLALAQANRPAGVHVVQSVKRFEWASMMVFDNARCVELTPQHVDNAAVPLFDLSFSRLVGTLPKAWNHLVGYDAPDPNTKLVHFTQGIPIWPETAQCEFAEAWCAERDALVHSVSFEELMGSSVHVKHMGLVKKA